MAREGLRTLVFGKKDLSEADYERFKNRYAEARTAITDRDSKVQSVVESLENGLELIGLTGVEDKLQEDVRPTLEMLRNAGIKYSSRKVSNDVTADFFFFSSGSGCLLATKSKRLLVLLSALSLSPKLNRFSNSLFGALRKQDKSLQTSAVKKNVCWSSMDLHCNSA